MCEPAHSIVQFPDPHEFDDDDYASPQAGQTSLAMKLRGVLKFTTKIGKWLNFSRLGSGHGGALTKVQTKAKSELQRHRNQLPDIVEQVASQHFYVAPSLSDLSLLHTVSYEHDWWQRHFHLDGEFSNPKLTPDDRADALKSAAEYNKLVCDGNVQKFRLFLERSIAATGKPANYYERFMLALQPKARDVLEQKIQLIAKERKPGMFGNSIAGAIKVSLASVVKAIVGMTRKRENMVDCFADDATFWKTSSNQDSSIIVPEERTVKVPQLTFV